MIQLGDSSSVPEISAGAIFLNKSRGSLINQVVLYFNTLQFFLQQWLQETLIQSPTKAVKTKEGLSKVFGENKVFPSEKTEMINK